MNRQLRRYKGNVHTERRARTRDSDLEARTEPAFCALARRVDDPKVTARIASLRWASAYWSPSLP
jgi:hypothetical protein